MEVLPCSDVQYASGNSDSAQRNSGSMRDGESNCFKNEKQVQAANIGEVEKQVLDQEMADGQHNNGPLWCDYQVGEGQQLSDDDLISQNYGSESFPSPNNSHLLVDAIENDISSNNREGGSSLSDLKWLECDESMALWVKWRGKWQTGIRCPRADWPLPTVKAKPTHDRKQYVVIFFPHNRNILWVDTLAVQPINEFPEPIAYRTHKAGLKLVKDLTVARRYVMKNLAIGMLNIVDQFHYEAFVETARTINVWKEFAMESSHCSGYSDIGRMLLKLQNMILQRYMNSDWLKWSSNSWVHRCQNANTAETTELLKEELFDSILWNDVKSSWDASAQNTLGSEWKYQVMRCFSTDGDHDFEQKSGDDDHLTTSLSVSRKRPKLEIRRAESHSSPNGFTAVEIDTEFFNRGSIDSCTLESEQPHKEYSQTRIADRWDDIIVEPENFGPTQTKGVEPASETKNLELMPINEVAIANKNRQCTAFIESKGRQCIRWANEGDVYCCIHLASRFNNTSRKNEGPSNIETPLCGGTTVLGTRCKHRSLPGSSFCKKHRPRDDDKGKTFNTLENTIMIKNEDFADSRALVVVGAITERPLEVESSRCIGIDPCLESPKRYSLYCDNHLPNWLKRARNGKSRVISKEVFINLLWDCSSVEQKRHLHQACELFYKLFKSKLSLRNPVPMEVQLEWALSEACKNPSVGRLLMKLVCIEKERLRVTWNLGESIPLPPVTDGNREDGEGITCKFCSVKCLDDKELVAHGLASHKKEAQWLFRGYACAICLDSFTNKKTLESHMKQRHHVEFIVQCVLLQCIPCKSHFGNSEDLWVHVESSHPLDFRTSTNVPQQQALFITEIPAKMLEHGSSSTSAKNDSENARRKFVCRFCGLKFNLLPDLGRHHQAAHMAPNLASSSSRPLKKGIRQYVYRLKSGRLSRPKFKKNLGQTSYHNSASLKKQIQVSKSLNITEQPRASLGRLSESHCSSIAKILFSEAQKTKPRPSNSEIVSIARSSCCKASLLTLLEEKYGEFPERLYLKAAKLCSEQNILVEWHRDGFVCPKGCNVVANPHLLSSSSPLIPIPNTLVQSKPMYLSENVNSNWKMDECHYIVDSRDFGPDSMPKVTVLCSDISSGLESVPVGCVLDERQSKPLEISAGSCSGPTKSSSSMPWESFTYITKPIIDPSLDLDGKSLQFGCSCSPSTCSPDACDHVYLFDNDYEDAKDKYGNPMRGRFPYDDKGRIILEEGYLVYECNYMCNCNKTCRNRVLQNGVQVKLEVFKTENKGWAVRAGEPILRGMFVCEWIGEVLDELESINRRNRYGKDGCGYMYNVNAHINDMSRLVEGQASYVIDATKYGNVSRFINHSCSPNLVNHQVLIDSMDSQRAHIGLYASRDIAMDEELSVDYHNEPPPGEGHPCPCRTPECRGLIC